MHVNNKHSQVALYRSISRHPKPEKVPKLREQFKNAVLDPDEFVKACREGRKVRNRPIDLLTIHTKNTTTNL